MINISPNADISEIREVVRQIVVELRRLEQRNLPNVSGWAGNQSNVTTDRTYDANSTSTDELADVLGTLIDDLLNKGLLE